MDEPETLPLAFAHRVIKMLAEHLLGDDVEVDAQGYRLIRVVFRKLGGSWFQVCTGSPKDVKLLIECVKAWGQRNR